MPARSYRVTIPVLIEDEANPHALAIHDKIEVRVEAHNAYEAARRLEHHWNESLPIGFMIIRHLAATPEHLALLLEWNDPNGGGAPVRQQMNGRFDGIDLERGVLRFTVWSDGNIGGVVSVIPGQTYEIPFEDISYAREEHWSHEHFEDMSDVQSRLRVRTNGHFVMFNHSNGGIEISGAERYVPRPCDDILRIP